MSLIAWAVLVGLLLLLSLTWGAWIVVAVVLRDRLEGITVPALAFGLSGAFGTTVLVAVLIAIAAPGPASLVVEMPLVTAMMALTAVVAAIVTPFALAAALFVTLHRMRYATLMHDP